MKKIVESISIAELGQMSEKMYDRLVKAVIDIEKQVMVVDAELHVDEEALLLEEGSEQKNLWGINLYPDKFGQKDWVEFDSMINLRPSQGNRSSSVENPAIQKRIVEIVARFVK